MFLMELLVDGIIDMWFAAMQLIIPKRLQDKKLRRIIKLLAAIFTGFLFLIIVLGVLAVISDDPFTREAGKWMILIPLFLSALQIVAGIIMRIVKSKNNV